MSKNYIIVENKDQFDAMMEHIEENPYLAFDTETTGLNVRKDTVIGLSISGEVDTAYYLPRFTWNIETNQLDRVWSDEDFLKALDKIAQCELLMWNGSFDVRVVRHNLNVDLTDSFLADIQLMKHTVAEEGNFGLKTVAVEYQDQLGMDMEVAANQEQIELKENVKKNGGSTTKKCYEMFKADLPVMGKYACSDADLTLKLALLFRNKLEEEDLLDFFYAEEVMPLYKNVTIPMEDNGIKLDLDLINETDHEIIQDMKILENNIIDELFKSDAVYRWYYDMLDQKYPASPKGLFGQKVAEFFELPLPKTKSGKYSLTEKNIKTYCIPTRASGFLLGNSELIPEQLKMIQEEIHKEKNGAKINISSKKQMGEIVFDYMDISPLSKTASGAGQFNDTMIQHLSDDHNFEWAKMLSDYNKLVKIKGTYIDRFLDNQDDGYYYFSYKQWGTISGRYGSDAQQLPRPKEEGELSPLVLKYNNLIRSFFIADEGRVFIDCDYESLEPHVFGHVSGDEGLRNIFRKGHDFYSTIAIATEKLEGVSADKKADNYLGKVNKPLRQKAKAYSLGVPYGLSPYALAKSLDVSQEEAEELYKGYLDGFPELKKWMSDSKKQAQTEGYVKTQVGRIRHLDKVKKLYSKFGDKLLDFKFRRSLQNKHGYDKVQEWYRDYKNGINNARNFQIQGLAASIVNRAAIAINKRFKELGIDGLVIAQIHDQLIVDVPQEKADEAKEIVRHLMENVVQLSIDLKAPPELGYNWRDAH